MLATLGYLAWRYPHLPSLLPVHFRRGRADGWQFRTVARVLTPLFVQLGIFSTSLATATLLLSRKDALTAESMPDARAAVTAAEAVTLIATTWVVFQAYMAYALLRVWTGGATSFGGLYTVGEIAGVVVTIAIGVRAHRRLTCSEPLPYVPAHWRLGQLYCNREHPALFVPTRDGRRWTLNFGRPAAVALLGGILAIGIVMPTIVLALALR
jgi:uncharacterized membrane protein